MHPRPTFRQLPAAIRSTMPLYPLLFKPILREKVWGGRRLDRYGKRLPADPAVAIGESWELADLPDSIPGGRSIVANGPLAGRTLRSLLKDHQTEIMGEVPLSSEGGFPLLIKFIDAASDLSIQVHPDAEYVAQHPDTYVKSEAWVILEAEDDAVLYCGLRPGLTMDDIRGHIEQGCFADDLIRIPARAGDCHYLPSGTCHALGAGIVVLEVQTPSDTTFRLFDWGRTNRELHIEEALACMSLEPGDPAGTPPTAPAAIDLGGVSATTLATTPYFMIERLDAASDTRVPLEAGAGPTLWIPISGATRLDVRGEQSEIGCGTTALLPAQLTGVHADLTAGSAVIRVTMPVGGQAAC